MDLHVLSHDCCSSLCGPWRWLPDHQGCTCGQGEMGSAGSQRLRLVPRVCLPHRHLPHSLKDTPRTAIMNSSMSPEQGSQAQQLLIKVIIPRAAITTPKIPLSISAWISCFCNADVSKRFICGHLLITFTPVYCFKWTGRKANTQY